MKQRPRQRPSVGSQIWSEASSSICDARSFDSTRSIRERFSSTHDGTPRSYTSSTTSAGRCDTLPVGVTGMAADRDTDMTLKIDRPSRRRFTSLAGGSFLSLVFGHACRAESRSAEAPAGRLTARPRADVVPKGTVPRTLGLDGRRDAILQLPPKPDGTPMPLVILLHGAGGNGEGILRRLGSAA